MITVFLADDHAVVRDGLRALIEVEPGFKVIGEADSGLEAIYRIKKLRPDVAVLDIRMPELNGIEACRDIHASCPLTQVIILSMHASVEYISQALQAGACGYILKESAGYEVVDAIRTAADKKPYFSQKILDKLICAFQDQAASIQDPLRDLSLRERQVLQLVVDGKSSPEIAGMLCLSIKTVETYRCRMMHKLKITNIPDLVKFAIRHGITHL